MKNSSTKNELFGAKQSEYSVEFECMSSFLVYFKREAGLDEKRILSHALEIANGAFGRGGNIVLERASLEGSYALVAQGILKDSANILTPPKAEKPNLKIVK